MILILTILGCGDASNPPQPRTQLVLLGTGSPNPDPERSGPGVAIIVANEVYLIDAGPGIVRRAAAAGLAMPKLARVFVTHLHSDHTLGLPDLIFTPWVLERDVPLQAFGPPGLQRMVDHIMAAWDEDIAIRTEHLQPHTPDGYRVLVAESSGGIIYRDSLVQVTAIKVDHGAWPVALAYRFDTPDGTIVISGDAIYTQALETAATGVDLLVHEIISDKGLAGRSAEWQAYHSANHTTTSGLARLATNAQPGLLVLYHQLFSGVTDAELLAEVRAGYTGEVVSGYDLQRFTLPIKMDQ